MSEPKDRVELKARLFGADEFRRWAAEHTAGERPTFTGLKVTLHGACDADFPLFVVFRDCLYQQRQVSIENTEAGRVYVGVYCREAAEALTVDDIVKGDWR